ncbi:MAG: hypothetical protein KatS3mg112_1400 [Thermogutta sp.]|nr:MAG: hypothetical protein KatS3mg112_1400 [Thermogutta sp.]
MAHLRIYNPDHQTIYTLGELFETEIVPRRPFWDPRTLAEYASTIHLWTQITGDPPITEIDEKLIASFSATLLRRPGKHAQTTLSRNTVRKHLQHLKAVLRLLSPKSTRGIGLLKEIPIIEAPRPARRPVTVFSLTQVRSLANGGEYFRTDLTRPLPSPAWWKALIRIVYNTAWRIGTALQVRWEWIDGNWITVPPEATKPKEIGRRYYLNQAVMAALDPIRRDSGRIFPWNGAMLSLQRWRRRIAAKVGVPVDERFGFHCLRRTALSALATLNPLVARIMAMHAIHDVLAEHYISDDVIRATLEQLPQPW